MPPKEEQKVQKNLMSLKGEQEEQKNLIPPKGE
jgi:hypothetical protein